MISRNLVLSTIAAVIALSAYGCGSTTTPNDLGNPDVVQNDVVSDTVVPVDEITPPDTVADTNNEVVTDVVEDTTPPCMPSKCIDDGNGNLIENPTPGCVGEFCAASPTADPDPMAFGPYPVGIRQVVVIDDNPENINEDSTPRTLKVDMWFPTTEANRDGTKFVYDIKADCNQAVKDKFGEVDIGQFPVNAILNAPIRHGEGRYPVVIFSHGAYGIRFQSIFFTIALASHGYIVIAPDHQFNTLNEILVDGWNGADLIPAAMHRPRDIFALLDWIQAKGEDEQDEFYDLVDMENVACTGHSFGGLTSYVVTADPRIDVIIPMAPAADMANALSNAFNNKFIDELVIPTLVMAGEMDKTLQYQSQQRDWFDIQPPPKWMLSMPRAGHYTFSDVCAMNLEDLVDYWGDADDALRDGCADFNFPTVDAHRAINLYAISFLNHFLRKSPTAVDRLVQEAGAEFGDDVEFLAFPE